MIFLLAQLVAPPVQVGPVRLPGPAAGEQRPAQPGRPAQPRPQIQAEPSLLVPPGSEALPPAATPAPGQPAPQASPLPRIEGTLPYGSEELARILAGCREIADIAERLNACAAALNARLVSQGYVNTRVYVSAAPEPPGLRVVEGRIVELRVSGSDERLNRRVRRLLRPLQGELLYLPRVERQLQLLRRQAGVADVRGNLTRLGSDPSQAVLLVSVSPGGQPWQGDLSLRNDGSNGSGEYRGVATLVKPSLALNGDTLLLYGEVNGNDQPQFGSLITSLSYSVPIADRLNATAAFGYSRRNLIELPSPADGFSTSQIQGLGQLEWVLQDSLSSRWSLFAAYSGNRSNTYFRDRALPDQVPEVVRSPSSGYLRLGVSGSGVSDRLGWGGNAFLLQGVAAAVPEQQRQELSQVGIHPSQARAIGGLVSLAWGFAPSWQLNLRAAGQLAFAPLLNAMQFSLGSDVGLRGLPGQLISGDNGLLGSVETVWTFWRNRQHALQLVPFIGAGRVSTSIDGLRLSDDIGSGGALVRWLAGENWSTELGWVKPFANSNNVGPWQDWLLGQGVYVRLGYRF
jgi:hemolysin activation/secretion protein